MMPMDHLAIATSWQAYTGAGGGLLLVLTVVSLLSRTAMMVAWNRRGNSAGRWPGRMPGGPGYGAATGQDIIGQGGTVPDEAGRRGQGAGEHLRREQDRAFWDPPEEEGTLPAAGFIGDRAENDPRADSDPG
jgi:hypothetical protein